KECNITCASLLTNDISEDSKTARGSTKVAFTAWVTYKEYCTGDKGKWISECSLQN
ncbi:hypothetical protein GWI33_002770, partial [Rhynchophorus ferrugineus]